MDLAGGIHPSQIRLICSADRSLRTGVNVLAVAKEPRLHNQIAQRAAIIRCVVKQVDEMDIRVWLEASCAGVGNISSGTVASRSQDNTRHREAFVIQIGDRYKLACRT